MSSAELKTPHQDSRKRRSAENVQHKVKSSGKRGRRSKLNPALTSINAARTERRLDNERSAVFRRWWQHTRGFCTGQGKHLRRAAKAVIILFVLSQFIALSDQHQYDGAHRRAVYAEIAKQIGTCHISFSLFLLVYSRYFYKPMLSCVRISLPDATVLLR